MEVHHHIDLHPHNTFGFSYKAKAVYFIRLASELDTLFEKYDWFRAGECIILGGGSNILLTQDIETPVLINQINPEVITLAENANEITLEVGAGKNWHDWVMWCVDRGFGGLENLSLIPGKVGAAPMQNIGAYGVELKDTLHAVMAFELKTGKRRKFTATECQLGYRDSIFKQEAKGKYLIESVSFTLTKRNHQLRTQYGAITTALSERGVAIPTIKAISEAVIAIRQSKLPDPKELGNSGSFFKNPVVTREKFESLQSAYPEIVGYPSGEGIKLAAGWLIERAGWKGQQIGGVGVHKKQALVLVHYGGSSGLKLLQLSRAIQEDIFKKFGVSLEAEVNIL